MATASPSSTLPLTDKLDALTITSTEIPPAEPTSFGVLIETLKPKLSSNGSVVVKGSEEYKTITTRWSEHNAPVPGVVVSVGCEEDISAVVRLSSPFMFDFPFLCQQLSRSSCLSNVDTRLRSGSPQRTRSLS